jgi:predicted P-loop ATPase
MSKKVITEQDFLKEDFATSKKYLPFDEAPEVIAAANEQEKSAWREVYSFAHTINRMGRQYTETDIINQCSQFYLDKPKVEKVLKKIFEENIEAFGIDDKPDIVKVEYFLNKNWEFIINEVTQRTEYRNRGLNEDFIKLNTDTLYRKIQHVGFKFPLDKLKSLFRSDFLKSYHPFKVHFESLPVWDYETDHIGKLANYITTTDQEFHVTQFRKMLVRSVGCALYGIENRFVYVLVGKKQETGKSTFIRFLNPFGTKYISESPIRDNPTTYFSFSENFMHNLEELASLSNVEVNHLKSMISSAMIKERKPYGIDAEEQPRRTNFFGSTNKDEFLIDDENARWLCARVEKIDWNYKTEVDIQKVWAQAFALYHDKDFNQYLTIEETQARDKMNRDFEITDIEKDLIKQCFAVANELTGQFFTNPDIITTLTNKFQGKPLNARFIGKSMAQLGFINATKRINGHKTRGYYVNPIEGATFQQEEEKKPNIDGKQKEFIF